MNSLSYLLVLLIVSTKLFATSPTLERITLPLIYLGADNQADGIPQYTKIPIILNHTYPVLMAGRYGTPVYAIGDVSKQKIDLNLTSVYGVKVSAHETNWQQKQKKPPRIEFHIDIRKAVKPANYTHPIEDVGKMTAKAIRLDHPDKNRVLIFLITEQEKIQLE